jgi:hypothetical protein
LENLLGEGKSFFRFGQQISEHDPDALAGVLKFAAEELSGQRRRLFMAQIVDACGPGGQRWAEQRLEWNRVTVRKGQKEMRDGVAIVDAFFERGRKKAQEKLPSLMDDIKAIADPVSQADPTFRTTNIYIPLTAGAVRRQLISQMNYTSDELPGERTISTKLDELGYKPQKVKKSKPKKKIPQTDAIFEQVRKTNQQADQTDGVLRISMDAKAAIKVGSFSRGGKNRRQVSAADHDFKPEAVMSLFGFLLPDYGENHFYFSKSKITADFIIDALESLWPTLRDTFNPHTLVFNLDNGPENNSRRTQFIKRMVDFAYQSELTIKLAYYPPYHSKYNPIERVWGILENHWNGELLDSEDKILGLASTMTWKGNKPNIHLLDGDYLTGTKLTNSQMRRYESRIHRMPGLEKWSVEINPEIN